jgi:hypothetical protein
VKYTRATISIPKDLHEIGKARAKEFRLSFSAYLARLVEDDARSESKTLTLVSEGHGKYKTRKSRTDPRALNSAQR